MLAACAQLPVVPQTGDFRVEGKVAIVEGQRRHTARFIWQQTADQYDVLLWGPLGQGNTRLRGHAEHVEITAGGQSTALSGHPDTVMRQQLGWSLPLAMLRWWLTGQPMPAEGVAAIVTDAEGRLVAFRQFGWRIRYENFDIEGQPPQPLRISAERPGYRIDLVVLRR